MSPLKPKAIYLPSGEGSASVTPLVIRSYRRGLRLVSPSATNFTGFGSLDPLINSQMSSLYSNAILPFFDTLGYLTASPVSWVNCSRFPSSAISQMFGVRFGLSARL